MHLARSQSLVHPLGNTISTPILVPSFSSKGFGFNSNGKSEISNIFEVTSEYLTEIMLISAYDIAYDYIPMPDKAMTDFTIVDSGGYEISNIHDLSTIYMQQGEKKEWDINKLKHIFDKWPEHIPGIFVSYDNENERITISEQIKKANSLFSKYSGQLNTLLLKPENNDPYLNISSIIPHLKSLRGFNIIGVTEKELGSSLLDRMCSISELRLALDDSNINAPIHVFGSLDPISTCLYFLAGAEIFDGLTWLRYGYKSGNAMYTSNFAAKHIGIYRSDDFIKARTMQNNLDVLVNIKNQMNKFLIDKDFSKFNENSQLFQESYELLITKNKRLK